MAGSETWAWSGTVLDRQCYFIKFCDARQVMISECEYQQYMGWIEPLCPPYSKHQWDVIISDGLLCSIRPPLWLQERDPQAVAELRDRGGRPQPHAAPLHYGRVARCQVTRSEEERVREPQFLSSLFPDKTSAASQACLAGAPSLLWSASPPSWLTA